MPTNATAPIPPRVAKPQASSRYPFAELLEDLLADAERREESQGAFAARMQVPESTLRNLTLRPNRIPCEPSGETLGKFLRYGLREERVRIVRYLLGPEARQVLEEVIELLRAEGPSARPPEVDPR